MKKQLLRIFRLCQILSDRKTPNPTPINKVFFQQFCRNIAIVFWGQYRQKRQRFLFRILTDKLIYFEKIPPGIPKRIPENSGLFFG